MLRYCAAAVVALVLWSGPSAAQWGETVHHIGVPSEQGKAASPQCSAGVVYDDGFLTDSYSIGNGDPGDSTMVMKFDLPAGTAGLDQACVCFNRLNASSPSSMDFEIMVYNDNGPGGSPGTLLGMVPATASSLPIAGSSQFYSVNLSAAGIVLPDTGVYVGARWPGGNILMCGDRSATTAQRSSYGSGNEGLSWTSLSSLFPTAPPRAMGIRVDPASGPAPTCSPSATAMCLSGGRFKVEATYSTPAGASGSAQVFKLTDETGYLWFFSASNVEAVVKVLNGCPLNNRYWVFAGGLTNVRTVITVTDTERGVVKTYTNPQSTAFQPIQDTSAFATCP